jgi:hypothetical protein
MARQVLSPRLVRTAVRAAVERAVEVPAATLREIQLEREPPLVAVPEVQAPIAVQPEMPVLLQAAAAAGLAPRTQLTRTAVPARQAW